MELSPSLLLLSKAIILSLMYPIIATVNQTSSTTSISWSKPNCPEKCGDVLIPYPFGIGSDCSFSSDFLIVCRNSTKPSTPFLPRINMEALNISIHEGTINVENPLSPMNCTSEQRVASFGESLLGSPFTISAKRNAFAIFGCENSVLLQPDSMKSAVSGCMPKCDGVNYCTTSIPAHAQEIKYTYQSVRANNSSSCGYAFPVDEAWLKEDYNLSNPFESAPLVLEWGLINPDRFVDSHARCTYAYDDRDMHQGEKRCECSPGFKGNPYFQGGCIDIDECSIASNFCELVGGACVNEIGTYRCINVPDKGLGIKKGYFIAGGLLGGAALLLGFICMCKIVIKRIKIHRRRKLFERNGGFLLEQHLSSTDIGYKKTKLFSWNELSSATDSYNEDRVLGRGGQGTVYKGMLTDGRTVAVKKSQKVDERDIEVFINEIVILSQINHRNIVKLFGCCLETEIPLLVYEFIPNGTLCQHIHDPSDDFVLSWEIRLRIASEIACALSYLHSAASTPIYHRDIKSTNILLDERYRAKISDFGTSRSVAVDQTHLTTRVLGTFGYLDPEYFQSSQFTEKSDVYSFGVVVVELLTGEKAVSTLRAETGRNLATYFLQLMDEGKLFDIIDVRISQEGKKEEIVAVAELARKCLNSNGKSRPSMKQVATELESIRSEEPSDALEHGHYDYGASDESYDCSSLLSITLER